MQLTIIGLGVNEGDISLSAFNLIKNCPCVVLRTENTASAMVLKANDISYISLDYLYEKSKNFDTLTKNICKKIAELLKTSDVCYLVDGACSEDYSSAVLIKKYKNVKVYEGVSKAGYALSVSGLSALGYTAVSAYSIKDFERFTLPLVVYDLDNALLAQEWKLKLSTLIGEEQKVRLYADYRAFSIPLYEMDRLDNYDYSTVLVVENQPLEKKERFDYNDLLDIVKRLRAVGGCPWDREQTRETICRSLIEECYELVDAVDKKSDDKICEETGDVLLQTAFYISFLEESLSYNASDVLSGICSKLISRHSHVFGSDVAVSGEDALKVWNKNKQVEKNYTSCTAYLDDVPKNFPAALRAEKVIKRATYCNYTVEPKESLQKINRFLDSFEKDEAKESDFKELIFTVIRLIKNQKMSAEELISAATKDFIKEFSEVENLAIKDGFDMKNLDSTQVEKYRNEIKKS